MTEVLFDPTQQTNEKPEEALEAAARTRQIMSSAARAAIENWQQMPQFNNGAEHVYNSQPDPENPHVGPYVD